MGRPKTTQPAACVCQQCGITFYVIPCRLKNGVKFCSAKCRVDSRTQIVYVKCKTCGKEMVGKSKVIHKNRNYCSNACKFIGMRNKVKCICNQCGIQFEDYPRSLARGEGKYCSHKCAAAARRRQDIVVCEYCKKTFTTFLSHIKDGRKYCSPECAYTANSGAGNYNWRGGSFRSGYRGMNWKSQRNLAYERDGGECQICHRRQKNGDKRFHVHHIIPFRYFEKDYMSGNDLSNLITLCNSCHGKVEHGKIPSPKRLL